MYLTNNKSIKMSNRSTTMEMYDSLGTNEKRAVNRLLRGLSAGNVGRSELNKMCRGISRACTRNDADKPKRVNGYIVFYREQYPKYRAKMPDAELGHIARAIGAEWKKLTKDQQATFNKQANQ